MTETTTAARSSYGLRKSIEAIKAAVTLEMYLQDQGIDVRGGRAPCPIHDGDNPQALKS